ncbi:MAG: LysR substrate-binding domain-containing protein [Rhodocyclaceae bacterium]
MTLQELRYIVALADTGHFGRAAQACFVTQSTLSTGLRKLEEFLGMPIFDRSVRRVVPTPAGAEIVESARHIVEEANRLRELARSGADPMERTMRVGVIPTLGPYYLPHVIGHLHRAHPKLRVLLREELTPRLITRLGEASLDASLLALPVADAAFAAAPLFREPFLAALPAGHALAKRSRVSLDRLAQAGLLLLEEGHCLRDQALEACHLETIRSEETRATSLETLRHMVAMGLGVTLIPALAGASPARMRSRVALRPLAAPGASRLIGLVWRRRSPAALPAQRLAETLAAHLPPGVTPPG